LDDFPTVPTHRRRARFFARLATFAIACFLTGSASAAGAPDRVVLVRTQPEEGGWDAAEQRTQAELEAAGFTVEIAILHAGGDLGALAKSRGAFAAIMVSRPADATTGILVHVVDRVTGKSTTRMLEAAKDGQTPERVALRAVELLYASLLELQTATPYEGEVKPTPVVEAVAERRLLSPSEFPGWALRGGASAFAAPGGIGVLAGVRLGAGYYVLPSLSIDASGAASAPTVISTSDASSDFALFVGRVGALYEPWPKFALSPALGVGAGIAGAYTRGSSERQAPARSDWGSSPFVGLSMAMAGRLRHDLRLRADVEVGRTFDPLIVRFGGEPVAHFGPSWAAITLGLEWVAAR